jgi:hypothetical protein
MTTHYPKEKFTLVRYIYLGWNPLTGESGDHIYVDTANKHPDPGKKLMWGYGRDGELRAGDYVGKFEKTTRYQTFEYLQIGRTTLQKQMVRANAIRKAVKWLEENKS